MKKQYKKNIRKAINGDEIGDPDKSLQAYLHPDLRPIGGSDIQGFKKPIDTKKALENGAQYRNTKEASQLRSLKLNPNAKIYSDDELKAFSKMPFDKLPKTLQEGYYDNERIKDHPDYNPSKSIEEQRNLNEDNSLRTMILRGKNTLKKNIEQNIDPVSNFILQGALMPGEGAANMAFDSQNRYFNPNSSIGQNAANFAQDAVSMFPELPIKGAKVLNKISKGFIPESISSLDNIALDNIKLQKLTEYPSSEQTTQQLIDEWKNKLKSKPKLEGYEDDIFNKDKIKEFYDLKPTNETFNTTIPKNVYNATNQDIDIAESAMEYAILTKDPRYLERVKNIDKEYGTNLEKKLKDFHKDTYSYANRVDASSQSEFLPFDISTVDRSKLPEGASATSSMKISQWLNKGSNKLKDTNIIPREINIAHDITNTNRLDGITKHELKHHWTDALNENSNYLKDIVIPKEANDFLPRNDYDYLSKPTEVDAYLNTNMRDEMVKKGILKDHFDELTNDKLTKFINENKNSQAVKLYFDKSKPMIYDRSNFINSFNKALPIVGGAAAISNLQEEDNFKNGGTIMKNKKLKKALLGDEIQPLNPPNYFNPSQGINSQWDQQQNIPNLKGSPSYLPLLNTQPQDDDFKIGTHLKDYEVLPPEQPQEQNWLANKDNKGLQNPSTGLSNQFKMDDVDDNNAKPPKINGKQSSSDIQGKINQGLSLIDSFIPDQRIKTNRPLGQGQVQTAPLQYGAPINNNQGIGQTAISKNGSTLEKYPEGGSIKKEPIITNNPNDPRLKAYNDSLNLYKAYDFQKNNINATPVLEEYSAASTRIGQPISVKELDKIRKENFKKRGSNPKQFNYDKIKKNPTQGYDPMEDRTGDKKIYNYYKSLYFNEPVVIGKYSSPDLVHKSIRPTGSYFDGIAESPIYKKPVQPIIYQNELNNQENTPVQPVVYQKETHHQNPGNGEIVPIEHPHLQQGQTNKGFDRNLSAIDVKEQPTNYSFHYPIEGTFDRGNPQGVKYFKDRNDWQKFLDENDYNSAEEKNGAGQASGTLKMYNGGSMYAENGLQIENDAYTPLSPSTFMLDGKSHAEGGTDISYGSNPVEAEKGEPISINDENNLVIFGNRKPSQNPLVKQEVENLGLNPNTKYKNLVKEIGNKEGKQQTLMNKASQLLENNSHQDKWEQLSFNAGKAMLVGSNQELEDLNMKKNKLGKLQEVHNAFFPEKKAKNGKIIKQYPEGGEIKKEPKHGDYRNDKKEQYDSNSKSWLPTTTPGGDTMNLLRGWDANKNTYETMPNNNVGDNSDVNYPGKPSDYTNPLESSQNPQYQIPQTGISQWQYGQSSINNQQPEQNFKRYAGDKYGKYKGVTTELSNEELNNLGAKLGVKKGESLYNAVKANPATKAIMDEEERTKGMFNPGTQDLYGRRWTKDLYNNLMGGLSPKNGEIVDTRATLQPPSVNYQPSGELTQVPTSPYEYDYSNQTTKDDNQKKPFQRGKYNYLNDVGEYSALTYNPQAVNYHTIQPHLDQPYNVSFQDRRNQVQSNLRASNQYLGDNPAAQAVLMGQANEQLQPINGEEFRTNQGIHSGVLGSNNQKLDRASEYNAHQYDAMSENAASNHFNKFAVNKAALQSLGSKHAEFEKNQNELQAFNNALPNYNINSNNNSIDFAGSTDPYVRAFGTYLQSKKLQDETTTTNSKGQTTTKDKYSFPKSNTTPLVGKKNGGEIKKMSHSRMMKLM